MEEHISLEFSENNQIILMGDLNIDFQSDRQYEKSVKTAWQDLVSNYNLNQIVQKPTRVTEQTQSLIDHIYVSSETNISHCCVVKSGLSDHFAPFVVINTKVMYKNGNSTGMHTKILYRDLKNLFSLIFLTI